MFRIAAACLVILAAPVVADDISPEQRKLVVDALLVQKFKGVEEVNKRLKALETATVNAKLKQADIPRDPTAAPAFPSKKAQDEYAKELAAKLEKETAAAKGRNVGLAFLGPLTGFDKNAFGWIENPNVTVLEVIDKKSAVLSIASVAPGQVRRTSFLLSGVDTSNMADGKAVDIKGFYFCVGNEKVGGSTLMKLAPFALTTDERALLGTVELKSQPK